MELSVYKIDGTESGKKVTLDSSIFGIEPNDHAIYLDVKQYLANQRQGTHKTKDRSEVSYSTKKMGRQKGGGGARHGSIKSNIYVGGGRAQAQQEAQTAGPLLGSVLQGSGERHHHGRALQHGRSQDQGVYPDPGQHQSQWKKDPVRTS